MRYTDPDGHLAWFIPVIVAAVGGAVNLTSNIIQGNIHGSFFDCLIQGAAAFGAGAAGGLLALTGPAGWAGGGALVGGTNAWLGGANTFTDIAMGTGIGALSGLAGGAAGSYVGGLVSSAASGLSPVLAGALSGAVGGVVGGFAGGFTAGFIGSGFDLSAGLNAGLNGMITGGIVGGVSGGIAGYKYALDNDINPWTGQKNPPKTGGIGPVNKGKAGVQKAVNEIKAKGGTIRGTEVTLELDGVRVRVDIAADFNGELHLIEVKNGPYARNTPNQDVVYPKMLKNSTTSEVYVFFRGSNAQGANIPINTPYANYELTIIQYK